MRNIFLSGMMVLGLASALFLTKLAEPVKPAAVTLPAGFTDGLVARVASPTALAFTPDGRMLITTQPGRLLVHEDGALRGTALDISSRVCSNSERGLLGIAVDPDFASNHYIYLYRTKKVGQTCDGSRDDVNQVVRYVLSDANVAANETVLVDNIPSPGGNHNAGDLHFGKDGYLYISVGDGGCDYAGNSGCAGQNDATRDSNILLGKILRITRDGGIPATNPYAATGDACAATGRTTAGRKCKETFASGLRNPFRMAFDPDATGTRFFVNDVGQKAWEEIDRGVSGADYGWNLCEGNHDNPDRAGSVACAAAPYTPPIHEYAHSTGCSSVTGGAFVPNGTWPGRYDDAYLFGDYVCGKMFALTPRSGGGFDKTTFLSGLGTGGPTTMIFGPGGGGQALYYTTYTGGGEVRRIAYTAGNRPPAADVVGDQLWDQTLTVAFDGSPSSDPDGDMPLTYLWDFDGDGVTDQTTSAPTMSHEYDISGKRIATLQVRDSRGALSSPHAVEVFPGNAPPVPAVTAPGTDYRFTVGSRIPVSGTATDSGDANDGDPNTVPTLKWEVLRHHNASHAHPYASGTGGGINIIAPPPEDLSSTGAGNHLEVRLTATDSEGLRRTVSRRLEPRRVYVTFRTAPVRLDLTVNGARFRAPRALLSWHGYGLRVEASRRPKSASGRRWAFKSWSDGRRREHVIPTPASSATYTAKYKRLRR